MHHSVEKRTSHPIIQIRSPQTLTIPPKDRVDYQPVAVTRPKNKAEAVCQVCHGCGREKPHHDKTHCCNCGNALCSDCCYEDEGEIYCSDCFDDVKEDWDFQVDL